MSQRYLVMGDNHGDAESLRRVLDDVEGEAFDYAVHVGDVTNAVRADRKRAAEQLREVDPLLAEFDDRARHGLVWVWGNRDYFGDVPADLDVGTEVPGEGTVTVGGQRFTNSLDCVAPDVVLVTHMETWRLLDHFEGRAQFCGNSHRGRAKGRRLNSAFLQFEDPETEAPVYGGYFLVEVPESGSLDVEMHSIGSLERTECPRHRERGVQFWRESEPCIHCGDPAILMREMAASAFYGLAGDDDTVARSKLVEYATDLWEDPPEGFRERFREYLEAVEADRYAPLTEAGDGRLALAERSYGY